MLSFVRRWLLSRLDALIPLSPCDLPLPPFSPQFLEKAPHWTCLFRDEPVRFGTCVVPKRSFPFFPPVSLFPRSFFFLIGGWVPYLRVKRRPAEKFFWSELLRWFWILMTTAFLFHFLYPPSPFFSLWPVMVSFCGRDMNWTPPLQLSGCLS